MKVRLLYTYSRGKLDVPKCAFGTDEEVLEEIKALLRDMTADDQIVIESQEISEEEYENLPEFES